MTLQASHFQDLCFHVRQLLFQETLCLTARRTTLITNREYRSQLSQRESDCERSLYQAYPVGCLRSIEPVVAGRTPRHRKQLQSLVVSKGVRADPRDLASSPERRRDLFCKGTCYFRWKTRNI